MKEIIHKISAIFLASLILIATLSFKVANHFCDDELVATNFIDTVDLCHETEDKCCTVIMTSNKESVSEKPCCNDEIYFIEGLSVVTSVKSQYCTCFIDIPNFINVAFKDSKRKGINLEVYFPPKIIKNFQTNFQTFLI